MSSPKFRYSISFGLSGCYLPDSCGGPYVGSTRKELADLIRTELEMYDMPASLFRQVHIRRLWSIVKNRGSSVVHFSLEHAGCSLSFHGLTEAEADEMEVNNLYN